MLIDLQPNILLLGGLKPLGFDSNCVERNRKHGDQVMSGIVGYCLARHARALRRGFYCSAVYCCARLVGNGAPKTALRRAMQGWACQNYNGKKNRNEQRPL